MMSFRRTKTQPDYCPKCKSYLLHSTIFHGEVYCGICGWQSYNIKDKVSNYGKR